MTNKKTDKLRIRAIFFISLFVIATGALYAIQAIKNKDIMGAVLGGIIALIILFFAYFTYARGNKDIKEGFPLKDERSIKVMEKASSKAFYISLYLLLTMGFISDYLPFRDVSQATGITVGLMALLFAALWIYYNSKEI